MEKGVYENEVEKVMWNANRKFLEQFKKPIQMDFRANLSEKAIFVKYEQQVGEENLKDLIQTEKTKFINQIRKNVSALLGQSRQPADIGTILGNQYTSAEEIQKWAEESINANIKNNRNEAKANIFIGLTAMSIGTILTIAVLSIADRIFIIFIVAILYGFFKLILGIAKLTE